MEITVQPGDTLTTIAAANPGTTPVSIANANGIKNINEITTGQVLQIPDVAPEAVIPGEEPGEVPSAVEEELLEKVLFDSEKTGETEVNKYDKTGALVMGEYTAGKFTGPGIDVSLEGGGDLDTKPRDFFGETVTETAPGTYSVDVTKGREGAVVSEGLSQGGITKVTGMGEVPLAPPPEVAEVKPSITGDEEPVLDGPPVVEEEIVEEPGEDLGITELTKESENQTKKIIYDSSPEDAKPVFKDVFVEIDALGFEPQPKNWYEDIAKNINEKIAGYNTKISDVAEEKMKPTFEGWDKFLAVLGSALGSYGSAMTGSPNFALKIVNQAIDRDTQAFLKSKEIRTKSLENQRMDLIMMRGEKLQMAQNRVTQLMQSETFKLSKTKAKADIKATYDKFDQELALNKQNMQLVLTGYIKDLITTDATIKASISKEERKRYVNSFTATDAEGNTVIIPGYVARDAAEAKVLTEDQKMTSDALDYIAELDELYESPEKYIPAWVGGKVAQRIDYITSRLELTFKRLEGMGANYTQYEQALIRGILPTSTLIDKFSKYKVKSASLKQALIKGLKTSAKVRGQDSQIHQTIASQENIQKFGGKKISSD